MTKQSKAKAIVAIEKLRLLDSEIFRVTSKYGIKTIGELDKLVAAGKLSEKDVGEDVFVLDHLLSEKKKLEKELRSLSIHKSKVWESLQDLLELRKPNFRTP